MGEMPGRLLTMTLFPRIDEFTRHANRAKHRPQVDTVSKINDCLNRLISKIDGITYKFQLVFDVK